MIRSIQISEKAHAVAKSIHRRTQLLTNNIKFNCYNKNNTSSLYRTEPTLFSNTSNKYLLNNNISRRWLSTTNNNKSNELQSSSNNSNNTTQHNTTQHTTNSHSFILNTQNMRHTYTLTH